MHIPKVAGQSIEQFFLDLHGLTWEERDSLLLKLNRDPSLGPSRLAHLLASEYVDLGHVSADDYASYFKFAFVRNPWARLVSEYTARDRYKIISFKEFVMHRFPEPDMHTDRYRHVIPQYDYLYDASGELMVDFVGKFENLQDDFSTLCSQLGIDNSTLPHRNASNDKKPGVKRLLEGLFATPPKKKLHYTEYYDDELIQHVGKLYEIDIETFGYSFE